MLFDRLGGQTGDGANREFDQTLAGIPRRRFVKSGLLLG
jgi:hypothetical protein